MHHIELELGTRWSRAQRRVLSSHRCSYALLNCCAVLFCTLVFALVFGYLEMYTMYAWQVTTLTRPHARRVHKIFRATVRVYNVYMRSSIFIIEVGCSSSAEVPSLVLRFNLLN